MLVERDPIERCRVVSSSSVEVGLGLHADFATEQTNAENSDQTSLKVASVSTERRVVPFNFAFLCFGWVAQVVSEVQTGGRITASSLLKLRRTRRVVQ